MRVKWKIALGLYCVAVLYLSSLPAKELPDQTAMVPDKVLHMSEYARMGILAWGAFGIGGGRFPWGLLVFCVCFGIGDECLQDWLDQARDPDVWDAAADAAGAFIGLLLSMVFWKR
ncbi:MAG: VanZ family protein [Verrucomicrobiota bacterium]|nr:VanZ family protein [Verrucomicrobiota bacterium]